MAAHINLWILIITATYLIPMSCEANDAFYMIANMANDDHIAGWALGSGANALKMDMHFDETSGRPTTFHHGTPCDCTCYLDLFVAGSVCHLPNACKGGTNVDQQLTSLLKYTSVALIYIDSKADELSVEVQQKAGREVVNTAEKELFVKGYRGNVLISGNATEYIISAATAANNSQYRSRLYFTVGQNRSGVVNNLQFLTSLAVPNIIYSTGISACAPTTYYDEIGLAGINRDKHVVSNVFIWTVDNSSSFDSYYKSGAR